MKKIFNRKTFLTLFIGIILGFITFKVNANITYNSDGVLYKKGTENITVTNALDELKSYLNYGNATADNITRGKTAIINGKKVTGTGKDNDTNYNTGLEEGSSTVSSETVLKVINSVYNAQTTTEGYSGISCSSMGSGAYSGDEDTVTATRVVPVYKKSGDIYYVLSSLTVAFDLHNGGWYWSASNSGSGSASASVSMTAYDKDNNSLGSLGNLNGVFSFFEHKTPEGMDHVNLNLYVHTSIARECDDGPYARIGTITATYLAVDLK